MQFIGDKEILSMSIGETNVSSFSIGDKEIWNDSEIPTTPPMIWSINLGPTVNGGIVNRYPLTGTITLKQNGETLESYDILEALSSTFLSSLGEHIMFNCTNQNNDKIQVLFNPGGTVPHQLGWTAANWTLDESGATSTYCFNASNYNYRQDFDELIVEITGGNINSEELLTWFENNSTRIQ